MNPPKPPTDRTGPNLTAFLAALAGLLVMAGLLVLAGVLLYAAAFL